MLLIGFLREFCTAVHSVIAGVGISGLNDFIESEQNLFLGSLASLPASLPATLFAPLLAFLLSGLGQLLPMCPNCPQLKH